jgi:hypothetical protein
MAENTDTGEEPLENPLKINSEKYSDENITSNEPEKLTPKQEIKDMEVHKHPHNVSHKKNWGEYLLEFFMIFLAVFLGFLAETERESIVEKHREKQFMSSLIRDLELDTLELSNGNKFRVRKIQALDSAILILSNQNTSLAPSVLYSLSMKYYGSRNFFQNNGTLEQLKNSGGLRLISNRKIVDSIEAYDQEVRRMVKRDDFETEAFLYNNRLAQKLYGAKSVIKIFGLSNNLNVIPDSSELIQLNLSYLDEYINNLMIYEFLIKNNADVFEKSKQKASNLIQLIKKEYPLD